MASVARDAAGKAADSESPADGARCHCVSVPQRLYHTSEVKEDNPSIHQQLLRNVLSTIPSPSPEPTCCIKEAERGQQIYHDGMLLMCVETIISMSIARTDLVGDTYNGQAKIYVGTVQHIIGPIWPQ